MSKEHITIQEAADLSQKSVQTIRRAIKAKKITIRKQKTPQGFNYLVNKTSVCEHFNIKLKEEIKVEAKAEEKAEAKPTVSKAPVSEESENMSINANDFKSFVKTMETLMSHHNEERQNFLRLVNTLQEKIFVLENQLNLLQAPQKKWYHVWK